MQQLFDLIRGNLIFSALLVVGGAIFVVKRIIVSSVEKSTAQRLIKKIVKDPSYAHTIAEGLDIPYGVKEGFLSAYFEQLKEYISVRQTIGNYQVLYTTSVSSSALLVFVLNSFEDFDVGFTGKGTDVMKHAYLTFLVRHDTETQRLMIYSDIYHTSTEKFLREKFLSAILTDS